MTLKNKQTKKASQVRLQAMHLPTTGALASDLKKKTKNTGRLK